MELTSRKEHFVRIGTQFGRLILGRVSEFAWFTLPMKRRGESAGLNSDQIPTYACNTTKQKGIPHAFSDRWMLTVHHGLEYSHATKRLHGKVENKATSTE